jgi:hypothetical protein
MKLSSLNTKQGAESGAWLHLKHPALGHLMWHGPDADEMGERMGDNVKPVRVLVRGTESETVRKERRAIEASRMEGATITPEEEGLRLCMKMIVEFDGVTDENGIALHKVEGGVKEFLESSDDLVVQVVNFSRKSSNFFSKPRAD